VHPLSKSYLGQSIEVGKLSYCVLFSVVHNL
jgi:hypothetical protein